MTWTPPGPASLGTTAALIRSSRQWVTYQCLAWLRGVTEDTARMHVAALEDLELVLVSRRRKPHRVLWCGANSSAVVAGGTGVGPVAARPAGVGAPAPAPSAARGNTPNRRSRP